MKILVVTPLYPPLHAGYFDFRVQDLVESLTARGHRVRVVTSNHGLLGEQQDEEIERRLTLSGAFGHERVTGLAAMEARETHNQAVLTDVFERFMPSATLVWSLAGLSKSLIFLFYRSHIPTVFGVSDDWLVPGILEDDWLRWWNAPQANVARTALEWTGKRHRLDRTAPTRMARGYDRIPQVYGVADCVGVVPGSVAGFRFDRLFFGSRYLKDQALDAGFSVQDAVIIPPLVSTQAFQGEVKPAETPLRRLLMVGPFSDTSGADTAASALKELRKDGLALQLTLFGKADSNRVAPLRSFALQHGLSIEMISPFDQARQLLAVLRQHDLLVHADEKPSWTCLLPMQAMACGLPVVGTRLGAASEWLLPGQTALTFTAGDYEDLAAQLRRMVREPALRTALATAGQERVIAQANEAIVLDRLESLIEESRELRQMR